MEPGQSRTLPSGITITANPDETKSVTHTDQQTGAVHTDVYNKHGVLISTAISTEVPGTGGMSRDTTITDSQGITSMRSVSNGRGGFTTWTANPDGTHSVQYPDQQIIKELAGMPIENVQLDPDGLGGQSTGISPGGSSYSSVFRMGADGITETALSSSDGTEIGITTIPGQTNGAPLSIVARSDNSRFVLYPDGTQVPIDRYNNVIGGPNYANQFDLLTGTWRSDPYHRRGPILMNADGTSHQEWFAFDENGDEYSSTAHFDTEGNITRLEALDYLGLKVTEFETKDGITTPLTTNFLDSGHVEDQSTLVLETAFMFVGIPSLGWNIGRQIGNRLIASQMTRQGISKASTALTLNHIGGPGSTAFLAAASATRRPTLTLPATQVYAPTGMWDATIALGQKTGAGIQAGINSVAPAVAAMKHAVASGRNMFTRYFQNSPTSRSIPATHTFPSGARWIGEPSVRAGQLYESIRSTSNRIDLPAISRNTGFDIRLLRSVKSHFFRSQHEIAVAPGTIRRGLFGPDEYYADLWLGAQQRSLTEQQISDFRYWIVHEYVERGLMKAGLPYQRDIDYIWASGSAGWERRMPVRIADAGAHELSPNSYNGRWPGVWSGSAPTVPEEVTSKSLDDILRKLIEVLKSSGVEVR